MKDRVLLAQGNGGAENDELIKVFLKHFDNAFGGEDAGLFGESNGKKYATSIDSFTITPIFFSGGDIGKLSICGSANDVAMMGAKPKFLSASFIIEEGFLIADLEKIAQSMSKEMCENDIMLISADTKVVARGELDSHKIVQKLDLNTDSDAKNANQSGIFITTSIIGEVQKDGISARNLQEGDCVIISGNVGTHGACIYCAREGINLEHNLQSDCALLWGLVALLIENNITIHAIRDATRGGIASLLNEWARASQCDIEINESAIPISNEVRGVCEILGIEAFSLANEGVCAFAIPQNDANKAVELLRTHKLGKNANIIGSVFAKNGDGIGKVVLKTDLGVRRYLEYPQGEILPRIC